MWRKHCAEDISRPFKGIFWECAPLTADTAEQRPFEFVVMDGSRLDRSPAPGTIASGRDVSQDLTTFESHLGSWRGQPVAKAFTNLGGDSTLVAPAFATEHPQVRASIEAERLCYSTSIK